MFCDRFQMALVVQVTSGICESYQSKSLDYNICLLFELSPARFEPAVNGVDELDESGCVIGFGCDWHCWHSCSNFLFEYHIFK